MAGTVVQTHERRGAIGVVALTVTADASAATVPDTALTAKIGGKLLALETNPSGVTAPTDNYDITLIDAEGHDAIEGVGANRSTSATQKVSIVFSGTVIHPPVGTSDTLTFKLANNAVNSAVVVVKLYYEGADA